MKRPIPSIILILFILSSASIAAEKVVVIPMDGANEPVAGTDKQLIYNDNGNTAGAEVYYDKTTGNVGFGTNSPNFKLDVAGDIKLQNSVVRFGGASSHQWTIGPQISDGYVIYANGAAGYVLVLDRISGNVGIGTTTPKGKLDVNRAIYQRGSQLHADYVFDPGYKLETIEQHTKFMWQEKHLTAVPGAQYDENGSEILELGSHRKGMLEELEKAHIFIDQLNNKAEKQKSQIQEQNLQIAALKTLVCQDHPEANTCR